jgi:UDP-glucose 4-epimerase
MKILVTGGARYIGSHACKVLARRGFEPIVVDNLEAAALMRFARLRMLASRANSRFCTATSAAVPCRSVRLSKRHHPEEIERL